MKIRLAAEEKAAAKAAAEAKVRTSRQLSPVQRLTGQDYWLQAATEKRMAEADAKAAEAVKAAEPAVSVVSTRNCLEPAQEGLTRRVFVPRAT